jgi:putative membrane protein
MVTIALYAAGVEYLDKAILPGYFHATTIVHSLLGFVISLLLVFRTNTAYERWWEGRKLWGALVNTSRNLALKLNAYLPSLADAVCRVDQRICGKPEKPPP